MATKISTQQVREVVGDKLFEELLDKAETLRDVDMNIKYALFAAMAETCMTPNNFLEYGCNTVINGVLQHPDLCPELIKDTLEMIVTCLSKNIPDMHVATISKDDLEDKVTH